MLYNDKNIESCRKVPMTAAAFSADGSVLAVAAQTVITLWDPDKNALVAVIGDTLSVRHILQLIFNFVNRACIKNINHA